MTVLVRLQIGVPVQGAAVVNVIILRAIRVLRGVELGGLGIAVYRQPVLL